MSFYFIYFYSMVCKFLLYYINIIVLLSGVISIC
uniref:Uncharacterized protein n=1 Tax=Digenea simplex TaxID=945030 RepID=A0A1Z1MUZ7_DIGSM|nr:hypothetical protein [Digenea simplex]ARW69565.1 hypothetical protein [Digenea simplex]